MKRKNSMNRKVVLKVSPSLALIKYWGKGDVKNNIPATSSLAVTLDSLCTTSTFSFEKRDIVTINGIDQDVSRFLPFFENVRQKMNIRSFFRCESENNFPTAAGLASSSSGFAAMGLCIKTLLEADISLSLVSSVARLGSASAARAVFGGFTILPRGAESAEPVKGADFWPDLRVIVVSVSKHMKKTSSRTGMALSKETSPYYESWLKDSEIVFQKSLSALDKRDLSQLGPLIRKSYMRMFSTMLSADPPLIYWQPDSMGIIHLCSELRNQGIGAWETMDAGPQVKIFCIKEDVIKIQTAIQELFPHCNSIVDKVGTGPEIQVLF
jgi:diphosphomevalonate decarboxylase